MDIKQYGYFFDAYDVLTDNTHFVQIIFMDNLLIDIGINPDAFNHVHDIQEYVWLDVVGNSIQNKFKIDEVDIFCSKEAGLSAKEVTYAAVESAIQNKKRISVILS